MSKRSSERGSTLLFVAVGILPILCLALAFGLDFVRYNSATKYAQEHLAAAAKVAVRRFPLSEDVLRSARQYLAVSAPDIFGPRAERAVISVKDGRLFLGVKDSMPQTFGGLLAALSGNKLQPSPVAEWVRATVTPFDTLIVLDASSYLAPAVTSHEAWSSPLDWPEAQFFNSSAKFMNLFIPSTNRKLAPRIATQQCWNAWFSALKLTALQLYSYFSNFELDQAGVGVFPGFDTRLDILRRVRQRNVSGAASDDSSAEAALVGYKGDAKADYFCAAAAEMETQQLRYALPADIPRFSSWTPPTGSPSSMVVPPRYTFNPDYVNYVSLRQSLWNTVARDEVLDFGEVLGEALRELVLAPSYTHREGLDQQAVKNLFFVMGDVPWVAGRPWSTEDAVSDGALKEALIAARKYIMEDLADLDVHLRLTVIIIDPPDPSIPRSGSSYQYPALRERFVEALTPDSETAKRLSAQVIWLSTSADPRSIVPAILGGERAVIISGGA